MNVGRLGDESMTKLHFALFAVALAPACATKDRIAPSFATNLDVAETDGMLVEWQACAATHPCIKGEVGDEPYAFGFEESPSVLLGKIGTRTVRMKLHPDSVARLGDHVIEMEFSDRKSRSFLTLSWNEEEQKLIDADLISNDRR